MKKDKSLISAHKFINLSIYFYVLIGLLIMASTATAGAAKPNQKLDTLIIEKQIIETRLKRYVIDTTKGIGREVQNITNKVNKIEDQFHSYNSELRELKETKALLLVNDSGKDTSNRVTYPGNMEEKIDSIAGQTEMLNQRMNDMGAQIEMAENIALKNSNNYTDYNIIKILLIVVSIFLFIIIVLLASKIGNRTKNPTTNLKATKPVATPQVSMPGHPNTTADFIKSDNISLYKKVDQLQTVERPSPSSDRQFRVQEQTTQDTLVRAMSKIENTLASISKDIKGKKISPAETKDFHKNIYELRDAGNTQEEIAKKLNIGKGEVELVLNLRKKGYASQQEVESR
ncbi:MAG: hypothetical protein PHE49_06875 [bacterium]|nr:hypothetical protein [bacterium]